MFSKRTPGTRPPADVREPEPVESMPCLTPFAGRESETDCHSITLSAQEVSTKVERTAERRRALQLGRHRPSTRLRIHAFDARPRGSAMSRISNACRDLRVVADGCHDGKRRAEESRQGLRRSPSGDVLPFRTVEKDPPQRPQGNRRSHRISEHRLTADPGPDGVAQIIGARKLGVRAEAVKITPVDEVFAR